MKLWDKSKRLNSFRLVVLRKESGSEFQYLATGKSDALNWNNSLNCLGTAKISYWKKNSEKKYVTSYSLHILAHRKLIDLANYHDYVLSSSPHRVLSFTQRFLKKLGHEIWRSDAAAFAENESLYGRISTEYKSSKLFWRILEDNKPKNRENRGKKTVHGMRRSRLSGTQFSSNAVNSVPLSFLPWKPCLFWWPLSANSYFLVFISIFRPRN